MINRENANNLNNRFQVAALSVHSSPLAGAGERDSGGMGTYLRELARSLGGRGHHVDLFTRAGSQAPGCITAVAPGVRLVHLAAGRGELSKLELYPHLAEFAGNLERFRRERGLHYDLIFSHYWLSGWAGRKLQLQWGVPHAVMFHTLGASKNASGSGEDEPVLRIESERILSRECHRVIVAAQNEKRELMRHYGTLPDRIRVIPCGVNTTLFRPLDRDTVRARIGYRGEKIVLYVGRIEPVKGIDLIIRAVSLLPDKERVRLLIVGGGEYGQAKVEQLKRLSRELRIEQAVTFAGVVEHELLPYYYNAASVTVIASHYESFGLAALESLACGTPVVATDVADLRSIIHNGETGFVIEKRSPGEFAQKVASCLSGGKLKAPPVIASTVAGFNWPGVALRLEGQFGELAAETI